MRPILRSRPRHFPSAHIVTMRGRTFRRPLTTTRDGRARGRGGRLPRDESLTCPPVAEAHRRTARRSASAGRPPPAARGTVRVRRGEGLPGRRFRIPHGRRLPRLAQPQRPHRRRHRHRLGHGHEPRQADDHGRPCGTAGERAPERPHGDHRRRRAQGIPAGRGRRRDRRQVRREVPPARRGRLTALRHLRARQGAGPRFRRGLPAGRLAVRPDRGSAVGPGARHPADVPALAAGRRRPEDEDHLPLAADLHRPPDRGDRLERTADARLPERRPGQGDLPGRPPGPAPVTRQGTRRHLGDRPRPARLSGRDGGQLQHPERERQQDGGQEPGGRQAVARRTGEDGRGQGDRRPSLRRPRSRLARAQRQERHRLPEPPEGRHGRGGEHRGDRPPCEAQHGLRLARGRCRRPVDRQGRHLRGRRQGDRPQRQPQGDRRTVLHALRRPPVGGGTTAVVADAPCPRRSRAT